MNSIRTRCVVFGFGLLAWISAQTYAFQSYQEAYDAGTASRKGGSNEQAVVQFSEAWKLASGDKEKADALKQLEGARGAYEAGVLLYLFDALPSKKLHPAFDIFTGSSIGALNTTFLASMADNQADAVQVLAEYWRSLTMNRVLKFGYRNLFSLVDMVIALLENAV